MLGWTEDLIYTLFLFWAPAFLLVASIPGLPRVVVGFLAAIAFLVVWHKYMGGLLGFPLAAILVVTGFIGRTRPKTRDPEAGKLLIIPFMLMLTAVAWMAMGPIWKERRALRQLPALESASVDGRAIEDLEAFRAALAGSLSCGDLRAEPVAPVPLVLEAGGQRHEYRLIFCRKPAGLILLQASSDRQLLYSSELLGQVEKTGVKFRK
jgi:hypothetical protein